jgi:hypothetical protein
VVVETIDEGMNGRVYPTSFIVVNITASAIE